MTDTRTPQQRSRIMKSIGQKNTKPEWIVRRLLHRLGYRFRLHRKDLPGTPDIVFYGRRKAIFVHGCYWHGHNCSKGKLPKSNRDYWVPKIQKNQERDARKERELRDTGWDISIVWQCQTKDEETLANTLKKFLGPRSTSQTKTL